VRIASYFPDDELLKTFPKFSKHEFIENGDEKCEMIFCASVTQYRRVPRGTGLPMVVHCWDLPTNWRSWCRNEHDYAVNVHRDSEISNQLHLMAEADLVIACSEHTQNVLKIMGIKSEVLHNFYGQGEINAILEGRDIKRKNRIIQVSRYALNKRFDLTLSMWAKIQDKYKDWELMLVGPKGDVWGEIKGTAMRRTKILGEQNRAKLVTLMRESKILVNPSVNEGMGLTPLEARHMGLDVVSGDQPWTHEFGYATKIFEPDNVDAYAQAVEDAIASPFETPQAWADMTADKYAKRFDNLIRKIK